MFAAWPGETGDKAARDWVIVDCLHDNRNGTAGIDDRSERNFRPYGNDQIKIRAE